MLGGLDQLVPQKGPGSALPPEPTNSTTPHKEHEHNTLGKPLLQGGGVLLNNT